MTYISRFDAEKEYGAKCEALEARLERAEAAIQNAIKERQSVLDNTSYPLGKKYSEGYLNGLQEAQRFLKEVE